MKNSPVFASDAGRRIGLAGGKDTPLANLWLLPKIEASLAMIAVDGQHRRHSRR